MIRKRPKNNRSKIDAEEVLFEGYTRGKVEAFGEYESKLSLLTSALPFIATVIALLLFSSRIYALQNETEHNLGGQASSNLFSVDELVADRGEIYDRNNEPLVWNTKGLDDEFSTRNYINESGFTHVLGFISPPLKDSNDNFSRASYVARSGVEKVYDEILQGNNGLERSETNAGLEDASGSQVQQAVSGNDLQLSLDAEIQAELYNSIESLANQVGFERGSGAIMDITTGELIAITTYPEYKRDFNKANEENGLFINLFTHGLFTPGSIVKPFMALGALNEGVISPQKQILSTKTIVIPNRYNPANPTLFSDWKAHGYVDVRDAISVSSNAYFYAVGGGLYDQKGIGINKINEYMSAFGLGKAAGVAGFQEIDGVVPSIDWKAETYPDDPTWRLGDTFNTSIGQYGWQVTPLQMLRGVAAIGNRGELVQPTLLKGGEQKNRPVSIEIDDQWYQIVHEGMRQAATEGTARGLNVPYVNVAAKTGTAELGVSKANVTSWVMGFWPYEKPRYAFVVLMNEGSRYNLTGATFVMRQLFDWMRDSKPDYLKGVSE